MPAPNQAQKVYVGMSGGVDSSLAAALLVERGFTVTGVYMKNWTQDLPGMVCPWADDLSDAKRVAVQLGIDFKVFDFQKEYKKKIVDYMIDEYRKGRTPNPDIMCNQEIKFKLFLETALEDGADMIATGHYARVVASHQSPVTSKKLQATSNKQLGTFYQLHMAADKNKDQTYFLYRITEEALAKTLFPLGEYTKPEVREMAGKRNLTTATRKESMGICFVGKVGIKEFLSQYVEPKPGNIIDKSSDKIIGQHDGAIFYTFGQRHGLEVGGGLPYYVIGKDMKKNEVYVTTDLNDKTMWRKEVHLTNLHWINIQSSIQLLKGQSLRELKVRLRHRAPLVECVFDGKAVTLVEPQRAIAPGQSAVLYSGETVLGGGIVI